MYSNLLFYYTNKANYAEILFQLYYWCSVVFIQENIYILVVRILKMKKRSNLICLFISLLPIAVLFFFYNSLGQFTNTKIFGSNGIIISRSSFIFAMVALSIIWYYISILISQRLIVLNSLISQVGLRSLVNLLFSALSILLILSNLRGGA